MTQKNEIEKVKNEIVKNMSSKTLILEPIESDSYKENALSLPIDKLAAFGIAADSLSALFTEAGGSGIYKVTVPEGMHMKMLNDGRGFFGTVFNSSNQISGQVALTEIPFDPVTLLAAIALSQINQKLDKIQEAQEEMLSFLHQKERSEINGDLKFLSDVYNNYKYNLNNELYKKNNHVKVLDIKQAAEEKIDLYREQISSYLKKRSLIKLDSDINKQSEKVFTALSDYQAALYLYGFSAFVEVLLLENFEHAYLDSVSSKINRYSVEYRELYTKCYDEIEKNTNSTVSSQALKGLSKINKAAGNAIAKVPIISNTQIDENLIKAGKNIKKVNKNRNKKKMDTLVSKKSAYVKPFVDNINTIDKIYNKALELYFDSEKVYLKCES